MVLICDPALDSLLHLHKRKQYSAPKGAHGNPAVGSAGPVRNEMIKKAATPPYLIAVPPGTVVKKKGSGAVSFWVSVGGGFGGGFGLRVHCLRWWAQVF